VLQRRKKFFQYIVLVCFLAMIAGVEFIRMSLTMVLLPSFLNSLHYNTASIGMIISANLLADNLMKSTAGWLIDRKGPWSILFFGSILVFLGAILILNFPHHFWVLLLASIILGIGVSPSWPGAVIGSIQIVGEEKRGTMISIISVVWLAGGGLGPFLMGFLIDAKMLSYLQKMHLSIVNAYKTGFSILEFFAIWVVVVCIVGWFASHKLKLIYSAKAGSQNVGQQKRFKELVSCFWKIKGLIPGMFFQTLSLGMLMPNLLPYAVTNLHLTEANYSWLLFTGGVVVIAFMIPVGYLADRCGTKFFLVAGFTMVSLALYILPTYATRNNIWYIVALAAFSYALIQPAWNALLAGAIPPKQRGVLMGLFMSIEGLGFGVGPIVGGLLGTSKGLVLFSQTGIAIPFYISSISLLIMAFVYLFYPIHQYRFEDE